MELLKQQPMLQLLLLRLQKLLPLPLLLLLPLPPPQLPLPVLPALAPWSGRRGAACRQQRAMLRRCERFATAMAF